MVEKLFIRCPACGAEHPSRLIQMDRSSFESCSISMCEEPCQSCGAPVLVDKQFVFFKDE